MPPFLLPLLSLLKDPKESHIMSEEKSKNKVLSQNTPITTALAIAICGGAFWIGKTTESLEAKIRMNDQINSMRFEDIREWEEESQKLLENLTKIIENNQRRLDRIELEGHKNE